MNSASNIPESQVCLAENGQFIAFWRGQLVSKLDGALRYFETQEAAWDFLASRDSVSSSMIGARADQRTGRAKPTKRR